MTHAIFHPDDLHNSRRYYQGIYRQDSLPSGISIHGGDTTSTFTLNRSGGCSSGVILILLLSGELRLNLGGKSHYYQEQHGGRSLLIYNAQALGQHIKQGEHCCKLTIRGIANWIHAPLTPNSISAVPLGTALRQQAEDWIYHPEADLLKRDIQALKLLEAARSSHPQLCSSACGNNLEHQLTQALPHCSYQAQALADTMNISLRTLQRRVHAELGITLQQWLYQERMAAAVIALTRERLSIGEVAWQCGYRHASNFIQAFRRCYRLTPTQYLQQYDRQNIQ